ncbi:alpha,alpha-trehalase nth1 [Coemansia sp. RSA 1821]|nr:alpha,alpha-trehalase nth1 [Coemansia sp. RSA 1821]
MAVVTRSQNHQHNRPVTASASATRHAVASKRKIQEGACLFNGIPMHLLSTIKQHVTSVAAGTSSEGLQQRPKSAGTHQHRSLRNMFTGSDSKAKYRRQPCPPITVQTKDISWPMGSGDRDSAQLEDYDVLSASEARSAQDQDQDHHYSKSADADRYIQPCLSAEYSPTTGTFPLSRRRAVSISRRPYTSEAKSLDAGKMDTPAAGSMFTATVPMHHTASTSTSISSTSTAATAPAARRASFVPFASPGASPPLSPSTPSPAFSYVDVRRPQSPLSINTTFANDVRVRRAGTLSSLRSSPTYARPAMGRSASPTRKRTDMLYQSLTSLDITNSASTVVSAALLSGNRPSSSRSGNSAASGTVLSEQGSKKAAEDNDALRGPPPRDDWDIVLDRIKEYRASHEAPVDTVGCEALTEEEKDPKLRRFRSLISLMLSAQTKDEVTAEAVRTLSQRLPGGLTPKSLSDASLDTIHECVRRVGFWQRKSNYIKEAARTCLEQYDGDIPRTVPQLLALPGVGPKMAYLAMHAAWQDTQGIGVDTHVLRITHRLGWVSESARTAEATRHSLESWMPKSLWREINPLLVGLGQTVCRGVAPKCGECPVNRFCPSAQVRPRPSSSRRGTGHSRMAAAHDAVLSDSAEFGDVDVEDLASMVRGAEHAVRSRKLGGRQRQQQQQPNASVKAEFPVIPESPSTGTAAVNLRATRARAASRLRPRQVSTPAAYSEDSDIAPAKNEKVSSDTEQSRRRSNSRVKTTGKSSKHFMRSRSNAASEEVRPEAKTDSVRSARAKASAEKLYSRRLSKSDMQWALGEDWDPDDSSSLSSLSDIEISAAAEDSE